MDRSPFSARAIVVCRLRLVCIPSMAKTQKGSLVPTKSRLGRCEALKIVILSTCVNDKPALGWKSGGGRGG